MLLHSVALMINGQERVLLLEATSIHGHEHGHSIMHMLRSLVLWIGIIVMNNPQKYYGVSSQWLSLTALHDSDSLKSSVDIVDKSRWAMAVTTVLETITTGFEAFRFLNKRAPNHCYGFCKHRGEITH